jgi:hypothetical protein
MLMIMVAIMSIMVVSCRFNTSGNVDGIPTTFRNLEFYNGAGLIGKFENCTMNIRIATKKSLVGQDVYYYLYQVTDKDGTTTFVDSESLVLKWW